MNPPQHWYKRSWLSWLLWPLSWLYQALASARKWAYQRGFKAQYRASVPVLIVGNISVGGSGKTPLVIKLVQRLGELGFSPAVISRGYKAQDLQTPRQVSDNVSATQVGDEPLLIYQRTAVPVVVFPRRAEAVDLLLQRHPEVDIIVCDDGLQHYALYRDLEIAVVDAQRLHGNGLCLPAGPLREPVSRLASVDITVYNGEHPSGVFYTSTCSHLKPLAAGEVTALPIAEFAGQPVHAVAGIGNPQRFFDMLRKLELEVIEHPFADHHQYQASELQFDDGLPIIMTEKDAVKCRDLAPGLAPCWFTQLEISLSSEFDRLFSDRTEALMQSLTRLEKTD